MRYLRCRQSSTELQYVSLCLTVFPIATPPSNFSIRSKLTPDFLSTPELTTIEFPCIEVASAEAQGRPHPWKPAEEDGMKIGSSNLGPTRAGRPRRPSFTLALSSGLAFSVPGMIALAFPEPVSAGEAGPARNVTIWIYNYAQATHAVLAGAEREASRIFAEAGVRILWFECRAVQSTADPQTPAKKCPNPPRSGFSYFQLPSEVSRRTVSGDLLSVRAG